MTSNEGTNESGHDTVSRRAFLRVGGLSFVGMQLAERAALAAARRSNDRRGCIFIVMTGGASPFETFDPKPDAAADIRGPLRAIATRTPGLLLSESLPKLAERSGMFSVIRSLHHPFAPIHETGLQLIQTGRLRVGERVPPALGAQAASQLGWRGAVPPWIVLPRQLSNMGMDAYHGQEAGWLGEEFSPALLAEAGDVPAVEREQGKGAGKNGTASKGRGAGKKINSRGAEQLQLAYGKTRFGQLLSQACELVDAGTRFVTVNLFDQLAGQVTWDCHGKDAGGTLYDYRDNLCPQFDRALSALLDELSQRKLLEETLVVAVGEMGRTPRINAAGGRDHWTENWSGLLAGGGVRGGRVLGATNAQGTEITDRPVAAQDLFGTIATFLGVTLVESSTETKVDANPTTSGEGDPLGETRRGATATALAPLLQVPHPLPELF